MRQVSPEESKMMRVAIAVDTIFLSALRRSMGAVMLLMLLTTVASAQSSTTGLTPPALTPGTPSGSYPLSNLDSINLFNGSLNFHLPLLNISGRGGAGMPIVFKIEQHWRIEESSPCSPCGSFFYPTYNWWTGITPGYGPGVMQTRTLTQGQQECPSGSTYPEYALTRITFTTSSGTEYELRDQISNGQPKFVTPCNGSFGYFNRGRVFITADGTSATFISDTDIIDNNSAEYPTGIFILRDGTRYRIENGLVKWMQDRNGNRLNFSYDPSSRVQTITDSLNRQVTIGYDVNDVAPYGLCDRIIYQGFGGATRIIRVSKTNQGSALRAGYSLRTYASLFPELSGASSFTLSDQPVVSAVWLPDGRAYRFKYNDYAELARVELPTGGAIEYDWSTGIEGTSESGASGWPNIYRRVIERRVYPNGSTGASYENKTTYSRAERVVGGNLENLGYVLVDQFNLAGTRLSRSKHYFYGYASFAPFNPFNPGTQIIYYTPWKTGKEYQTELMDFNGVTVLRRETNTFQQREPVWWWSGIPDEEPPNDPRVVSTVSTWTGTNQVAKQNFSYDQFNNRTVVEEFDYGVGAPPVFPARRSETDYVVTGEVNGLDYTGTNIHLRSLPKESRTFSVNTSTGVSTLQAKAHFYYDEFTLTDRPGLIVYSAPATAGRGNLTSTSRWLNTTGGWITSTQKYDIAGHVIEATDALGNTSQMEFAPAGNSYAFMTTMKTPVPDPTGQRGSTTRLQMTVDYDYASGFVNSFTDPNGNTTYAFYNDTLDRLTSVVRPAGGGQTSYIYSDTPGNLFVRTQTTQSATQTLEATAWFDGLGRTFRASQSEGATSILADTVYDALGRVSQVSNPYRSGDTLYWTTTQYDALGRVVVVTLPGGAQTTSTYSGNSVTATDPAGKARKAISDALGRVVTVIEDPGSSPHLNLQTNYIYDALNNLRKTVQGAQERFFLYDSLSRLLKSKNPEHDANGNLSETDPLTDNSQWSMRFFYDNNGNTLTGTDARDINCTFTYDALNRMTTRTYSNDPNQTRSIQYKYDGAGATIPNALGKLTAITTSGSFVSACTYDNFDAMGRLLHSTQTTDNQPYGISYEYDLAGNLTRQTYPSGRVVETAYDAAGRISQVASGQTVYASSINYWPHGGVKDLKLGNNLWEHSIFNERLQPTEIGLGSTQGGTDKLRLNYTYGTTANNGDLLSQTITIPAGPTLTQNYTYDELNRLKTAQENNGTSWKQTFLYDRFGNRTIDVVNTTPGYVGPNPSIDSTRNRIAMGQGFNYDAAGNMTSDNVGHSYGYDAENMQVNFDNGAARYYYDGNNKRVKSETNSGAVTTIFVYDAMGKLVAEYSTMSSGGSGTSYLTGDLLGSPRIITAANQSVKARHDYLPFGEEIGANVGGRTTGQGYVGDNVRQKFTGKQRDGETGLDYFESRYYSSSLGRFTSADSFNGYTVNPQSLNLYAYTQNNPLTLIDPTGHDPSAADDVDYYDDEAQEKAREYQEGVEGYTEEMYEANLAHTLQEKADREAEEGEESSSEATSTQDWAYEPFVVRNADELEKQVEEGTHPGYKDEKGIYQCALLSLAWENDQRWFWEKLLLDSSLRRTSRWVMGDELSYGANLKKGTVVATFNRKTGQYAQTGPGQGGENHTAIFLRWEERDGKKGMVVIEQVGGPPQIRHIAFDNSKRYLSNAGAFNVVRIPNGCCPERRK